MNKQIIAYINIKHLPMLRPEHANALSILNLSFGKIRNNEIVCDLSGSRKYLGQVKRENPDIKIVLSVGGWGAGGFSETAATEEGRKIFASSALALVDRYQLDGIDIDWEYPCINISGIAASDEDRENYTLLLKELRHSLDRVEGRRCVLNIAVGGGEYFIRCTDMKAAEKYLDFVQIMTYDLRGGYGVETGHHTNLYDKRTDTVDASVHRAVESYLGAGVPREKLVIGGAFYSRMWTGVPNAEYGWRQMAQSTGGYGPDYGELKESYINKNGFVRYWDEEAKAPWLFNGETFISYDDEESLSHKIAYLKEQELAGIMFWEYGCDKTGTLMQAIMDLMDEKTGGGKNDSKMV